MRSCVCEKSGATATMTAEVKFEPDVEISHVFVRRFLRRSLNPATSRTSRFQLVSTPAYSFQLIANSLHDPSSHFNLLLRLLQSPGEALLVRVPTAILCQPSIAPG